MGIPWRLHSGHHTAQRGSGQGTRQAGMNFIFVKPDPTFEVVEEDLLAGFIERIGNNNGRQTIGERDVR